MSDDFMHDINGREKKMRELMDKYGDTREAIENKCTNKEWYEYLFAGSDEMLAKMKREKSKTEPQEESVMKQAASIKQMKETLSMLGYYSGKIDSLATPGLSKAMNDFSVDHDINEENLHERLASIKQNLRKIEKPARLDFDGRYLRFIQDGKIILQLNAMSGRPEYQSRNNQDMHDKGPLPEGNYRVKQSRIQDVDMEQGVFGIFTKLFNIKRGTALGGYVSWGKTRVWLEPFSSNVMHGRDKFTIHGGATLGSAGCIDIPGHTKEFFDVLRQYGNDVILNVHYDKEKLR